MLPGQLASTVAMASGMGSVALCFLSLAICSVRDLSAVASGPLLPHPRCPFCALPGLLCAVAMAGV